MKISFHKYNGTGNDFILIDNRQLQLTLHQKEVERLCDRHFGIGADGLIFLNEAVGFDFGMVYYNADGNESTMCGNGGRCITAFALALGIIRESAHFIAIDGEHRSRVLTTENGILHVSLKMKDVTSVQNLHGNHFLDTGSPHYVVFSKGVEEIDVFHEGRILRNDRMFAPHGTNVNFVERRNERLFVRTYERGVEGETLSCGTGVTAAAIASHRESQEKNSVVNIGTPGGDLCVRFKKDGDSFNDIWLEGPVEFVFEGSWRKDVVGGRW